MRNGNQMQDGEMESRTVNGRELSPVGRIAGRIAYTFTLQGVVYRITPHTKTRYMLWRQSDSHYGYFDTLEEAVAHADVLVRQDEQADQYAL